MFSSLLQAARQAVDAWQRGDYATTIKLIAEGFRLAGQVLEILQPFMPLRESEPDAGWEDVLRLKERLQTMSIVSGGCADPDYAAKVFDSLRKLVDVVEFVWRVFFPCPDHK